MKCARLLALVGFLLISKVVSFGLPAPGDEHWDPQFGPVGANSTGYSVTVLDGKVYMGGLLSAAGNSRANFVAGYDGTNWFALNNGVSGNISATFVFALANDDKYVYAGGWFTNADGQPTTNVARWDGTNWSGMGGGLKGVVEALKIIGTNLYAGGIFPNTNGVTFNCLARWTGTSWAMVPGDFTGVQPTVVALETDGTNIYVGGQFDSVAGLSTTNVARWNGSAWSSLGSGISASGFVSTLLFYANNLYAGGSFTNASSAITNAAVWNGVSWAVWANTDKPLHDLIYDGAYVYAGGEFTAIGGFAASGIVRWDGANWFTLGAGLQGFGAGSARGVYKMALGSQGRLYAVGNFNAVDGLGVSHVAGWDGNSWFALGGTSSKGLTHFLGQVSALFVNNGTLYAGGLFTEAGDQVATHIAAWDGTNWAAVAGGVSGTSTAGFAPLARCFTAIGSDLYVGGSFANAGTVSANNLARWDGSSWWPLGFGPDSTVRALATDGTRLYAGGIFTNVDGVFSPGFAVWDGIGWSSLGMLSGGGRLVNAIAVDGSDIYIGGNFTAIDGAGIVNVAHWNGTQWNALGSGLNATVSALTIANGILYAGGSFTTAGGLPASRIAKWDGANWSPLGSGLTGTGAAVGVSAIASLDNEVFVGGPFSNAGGVAASGIAKWDGANWSALGSGLSMSSFTPTASALALMGNDLYAGGNFYFAGDKPSMYIARWNDKVNFYPPPRPILINAALRSDGQFQFRLSGTSGEQYVLQASTDLKSWTPLLTNTATLYDFVDKDASNFNARAYRAQLSP